MVDEVDEVVITLEDGTALTEAEFTQRVRDLIITREFTVSVGETRQVRQYEPNNYHMSVKIGIDGLSEFIAQVADQEQRGILTGMALGQLTGRVKGMIGYMKHQLHEEQQADNIPRIDWRQPDDTPEENGEE